MIRSWSPNAWLLKTIKGLEVKVPLGGMLPVKYKIHTKIQDDDLIVFFSDSSSKAKQDDSVESNTERLWKTKRKRTSQKDREFLERDNHSDAW